MARSPSQRPGIRVQRRARKETRILAAARALLRQHGHEGLSLRQVARRARMSPAGMYEFFKNREHLLATLAAEANEALVAALRGATADVADPVERLARLGVAYIDFAQEHPEDFLLLFGRCSMRRSLTEDIPEDSEYAMIRNALSDLVVTGKPDGTDASYLEVIAYGFWSTIHGMAVLQLTHLAGFGADFATAQRLLLKNMVRSWQHAVLAGATGSSVGCGDTAPPVHAPDGPQHRAEGS
jgi:AcrR family transcriptional regulator